MKNFKKFIQFLKESWQQSKPQTLLTLCALAVFAGLFIAITVALAYGALQVLKVLAVVAVVVILFVPGVYERLTSIPNNTQRSDVQYPVFFGYDGTRIVPADVDSLFADIRSQFSVCYFLFHAENDNRLTYYFKCYLNNGDTLDYNYIQLVQKKFERTIAHIFSDYSISPAICQNIVAADISHGQLRVSFAKNDAGIHEIWAIQERVRRKYMEPPTSTPSGKEFTDQWDV